jgi:hypothetical protein
VKATVVEKEMNEWTLEEKKDLTTQYGCELIFERATLEQVKDESLPSDVYIIIYEVDGKTYTDLCRGSRVRIFDLYYDKFGKGVVKKIDFGYGTMNPKLWGYKQPVKKKKR